jgi:hypothetical protein
MEPAGNARPVEPRLPAENPWGNPIRWSCLKIPCHCAFHLRFPRGKTLWIGVYRPPPTPGSHGCDSLSPRGWRLGAGCDRGSSTGCSSAPTHGLRARGRDRASAPFDDARRRPLPARHHGYPGQRANPVRSERSRPRQTADPVSPGQRGRVGAVGGLSRRGGIGWARELIPSAGSGGAGGVRSGRRRAEPKPYGRPKARIPRVGADEQPGPNPDLSATAEAGCPNLSIPPKPARRP